MKKLMTAFALCAAVSAMAVDSANIVGYMNKSETGQFPAYGAMFVSVGSTNGTWELGDLTASGMVAGADVIQFLSASDLSLIVMATYIDEATSIAWVGDTSIVGWWNSDLDTPLDAEVFAVGTTFLANFSSTGITITFAGEVLVGSTTLDLSGLQFPFVSNFVPKDLTLGDLSAIGMVAGADVIQFLSASDLSLIIMATYIDEATSIAWVGDTSIMGWWNSDLDTPLDTQSLPSGSSFLGNFSSSGVQLVFPSAI